MSGTSFIELDLGVNSLRLGGLHINFFAHSMSWALKFSVNKCAQLNFDQVRLGPSVPLYNSVCLVSPLGFTIQSCQRVLS